MTAQILQPEMPARPMLNVTDAALEKLAELLTSAGDDVQAIRVFVAGGGCSGMGYGMTYADQITEYDHVVADDRCKVVIDAVALNYLAGAEIDFVTDGLNPSFVFRNAFQSSQASGGGGGRCGGCGGGCGR